MFGPARRYDPPTPGSTPHTTVPVGRSPCMSDAHRDLAPQESGAAGMVSDSARRLDVPEGSRDREPDPARTRVDVPQTVVTETATVMRQPDGLRASGPKTWSWTHGTTRRRSDEPVNIPQTAL